MSKLTEDSVLVHKLKQAMAQYAVSHELFRGELTFLIRKEALVDACHALRGDEDLRLGYLSDVVGVDYLPARPRFAVVYHLYSIEHRFRLRLKVLLEEGESIASVAPLWRSADWAEREVYDMFGIVFDGHPDMRRIYMPHDWEGFPLRKDYPLRGYKDQYNPFGEERGG